MPKRLLPVLAVTTLATPSVHAERATSSECGAGATAIHEIQGVAETSQFWGREATLEGVVVGDFQGPSGLDGFFVQQEDDRVDDEPLTSEGMFVFDAGFGLDVAVGDLVRVSGVVSEFFGLTELESLGALVICDQQRSVAAVSLHPPGTQASDLERFEGMLVHLDGPLVVTQNYDLHLYGELDLSWGERLYQPTHRVEPGSAAREMQSRNDRLRLQLDDGSSLANPAPPPYLARDGTLRCGDSLAELTGVLAFGFDHYEIHPVGPVEFVRTNPRSDTPPDPGGTLRVASFNVFNTFTTLDTGVPACGPTETLDCRGARSETERLLQRSKLVAALERIDADIAALLEVENDLGETLSDLVAALSGASGEPYAFVETGTLGSDAIKVSLIYKPETVELVGDHAVLDSSVNPEFDDSLNRPVLAQTFEERQSGERFSIVVNHLKSKGSPCDDQGDPDTGDGQGNCNATRLRAVQAEIEWLASDPTASGDPDLLVIGDLNSYGMEDPVRAFLAAGFVDLGKEALGPSSYSYVFDGQSGALNHAFSTESLEAQVAGLAIWHINADEPRWLDYEGPGATESSPFRSSDHDPLIVGLSLGSPYPPDLDVLRGATTDGGLAAKPHPRRPTGAKSRRPDAERAPDGGAEAFSRSTNRPTSGCTLGNRRIERHWWCLPALVMLGTRRGSRIPRSAR